MLSRVADSIYWMSTYIERAENYARFLDVNYNLSLELHPALTEQWKPLVVATGDWELFESLHSITDKGSVIYFLGFDENNPNSIYNCIIKARENARTARPEITKEVWEQINFLYFFVKDAKTKKIWQRLDPRDFLTEIKKGCMLLYGIFDSTITRNEGWHFGKIGQLLERADKTSRILDVKYHMLLPSAKAIGSPLDIIQWAALLKSVSAYDMYRKSYGTLVPGNIVDFLLLDKDFPRAILWCLIRAEKSIHHLVGSNGKNGYHLTEKRAGVIRSQLEYTDVNDIFRAGLHEYLDDLQIKINMLSNTIFETFFSIPKTQIKTGSLV